MPCEQDVDRWYNFLCEAMIVGSANPRVPLAAGLGQLNGPTYMNADNQ